MYTVNLTYFKETGKYDSDGSYESDKEQLFEIVDEVREKQTSGNLPGMVKGYRAVFITVDVPDHPHNHPRLCILDNKARKDRTEGLSESLQEEIVEEKKVGDPIEQDPNTKKWYFWDEIWVDAYGPFDTRVEAEDACAEYCKTLERGREEIPEAEL